MYELAYLYNQLASYARHYGPNITLYQFFRYTRIPACHVYRRAGNWTNLRIMAGLPPHVAPKNLHSDEHLFQELSRVGDICGEFPTVAEFDRLSQRSWGTVKRRFGRRHDVWRKYYDWLNQQPADQRPGYLKDLPPDADPSQIPGVQYHLKVGPGAPSCAVGPGAPGRTTTTVPSSPTTSGKEVHRQKSTCHQQQITAGTAVAHRNPASGSSQTPTQPPDRVVLTQIGDGRRMRGAAIANAPADEPPVAHKDGGPRPHAAVCEARIPIPVRYFAACCC